MLLLEFVLCLEFWLVARKDANTGSFAHHTLTSFLLEWYWADISSMLTAFTDTAIKTNSSH